MTTTRATVAQSPIYFQGSEYHPAGSEMAPRLSLMGLISSGRGSVKPTIPSQMNTPPDQLLDMRLFHHYLEMTSDTYQKAHREQDSETNEISTKWVRWIVPLATRSQNVLDALLSLSAFHLRYLNVADRGVVRAGHKYITKAIEGHSRQLRGGINAYNAEEVIATSICVAFYVTSGRHLPDGEQDLSHWFQPWQGLRAVIQNCWGRFETDDIYIKGLISYEQDLEMSSFDNDNDRIVSLETFKFLLDDLSGANVDPEDRIAYETSIQCLNKIYVNPVGRHALKFPAAVSKRYALMVAASDPRALCILGYFLMLVAQSNPVWWLEGAAERDFDFLMQQLPDVWRPKMEWAVREFDAHKRLGSRIAHQRLF